MFSFDFNSSHCSVSEIITSHKSGHVNLLGCLLHVKMRHKNTLVVCVLVFLIWEVYL
jgi:hypothetical protein